MLSPNRLGDTRLAVLPGLLVMAGLCLATIIGGPLGEGNLR
ncbi:MAG: hypothetical protein WKF60_11790 [Ilumatobacter sp.]